jgi:phenylacetate-CoA ligase
LNESLQQRYVDTTIELAEPEAIRQAQWRKLKHLLERTWRNNAFFREHWRRNNPRIDIASINSAESFAAEVPTVEKADFIADQEATPPYGLRHSEILAIGDGFVPILTSGTTGQGVEVHLQSRGDVLQHSEVNRYYFRWAGLNPGDRIVMPMHVSLLAGGRCEYHAAVDYGLSVFPIGMYDTARRVELMKRFQPRALIGTTSYMGHLSEQAGEACSELGLEILLTGAEAASNAWFKRLENKFGARAYDRYGLSQMATDHMFSCEHGVGTAESPGTLHNIDPFVLLEVIDVETGRHVADGERGELVLTSLYRETVPMIRCRTRDTAVYRAPRRCSCGRSFSGIEIGTVARLDDVKKIKGINVWPQAMDETVFRFPEIRDYQVVLTTEHGSGEVAQVNFAAKERLETETSRAICERLTIRLREVVGIGFQVREVEDNAIPRGEHKARRWVDQRAQFKSP